MPTADKPDALACHDVLEFPASVAQEAFFFLDQVELSVMPFNIPTRFSLKGPIDLKVFEEAINLIVERHEILRTAFCERDGELHQVVVPTFRVPLRFVDISHLSGDDQQAELNRLGAKEGRKPFDLSKLPLMRVLLVRLAGEDHVLHIAAHHSIADGWSIGLIVKELAAHYENLLAGRQDTLAELPIQYADYAVWQREFLAGPEVGAQLEFWKRRLEGFQETELLTDFPRPSVKKWNGEIVSEMIPPELTERLRHYATTRGSTLFHVFIAVFNILLRRLSGSDDQVVGCPVAGRDRPELEPLIGTFINTVILRCDLSGNPRFSALLDHVRVVALEAMENHDIPFETLVKELRPQRHAGRNPLFQINYTHQRDFVSSTSFGGISLQAIPSISPGAIFDLHFFSVERDGVWRISCDFCTDLFMPSTAKRLVAEFRVLLESAAENPECPIDEMDMIGEDERRRLIEWGGRRTDYPRDSTIGELLSEIAGKHPSNIALVQDERRISYEQFHWRACALAREIGAIEPGRPVAIFTSGTLDVIVGLAGILLAGGAYLPIDPALPWERIEFLLRDSGVSTVVITTEAMVIDGVRMVSVPGFQAAPVVPPMTAATAMDAAYVLYTSGSTGQPKGVVVPHRAVIRLVRGADYMDFREDEVFLQAAPLSFDASTFEIWGALLSGATLVVPSTGAYALDRIASAVRKEGVTTLWLTSGLFQTMVDEHLDDLSGLRNLLAGGDVLSAPHLRRAMTALPKTRLINGYGPTENTTFTTCQTITSQDLALSSVPIGKPIPNSTVFILNDHQQMVPVGIPGELYVGGDGLALGYLNDSGRTAATFVDGLVPGAGRLYRTGDLARWSESGAIEFLGRRDRQVKIRGVRVEPAEVEAALAMHPKVAECRVGTRGRTASNKTLVAWIRPHGIVDRQELGDFLAGRLPAFLRPDSLVFVERFPLTTSGKMDFDALPDPNVGSHARSAPPETETEIRLSAIWCELLGASTLGRDDNFFDLGGHSLLALRLFSRIHREFGLVLPLATLLRAPTLRILGSFIDRELTANRFEGAAKPVLAVLNPDGAREPLFFVHGGDGGVLLYKKMMAAYQDDRPVLAIESPALHSKEAYVVPSIEETAELYLRTVRKRQPVGPYFFAGYSYGGMVAYEMALQVVAAGDEVSFLAVLDTLAPGVQMTKARLPERLRRHLEEKGASGMVRKAMCLTRYFARRTIDRFYSPEENAPNESASGSNPSLRAAHAASMHLYKPGRFGGKLTLLRARDHGGRVFDPPPDLGWSGLVKELEILSVPGSHITLFEAGNIEVVSRDFLKCLSDV